MTGTGQQMAAQVTAIFEYGGMGMKISVSATVGLDDLLQLVATRWKIAVPIVLEYVDKATGRTMVLGENDNLSSLLSQNFEWKVYAAEAPPTAASGTNNRYDTKIVGKKDNWIELIPDNWECKTKVQKHPFFISYQQASETLVARNLFDKMKTTLLEVYTGSVLPAESRLDGRHAFWDAECLSFGQDWGINFMSGLFHSKVIVLLCSDASMKRMLEADKKPDNCLLEWELALQMSKERGHDILPVLLSSKVMAIVDGGKKEMLWKEFSTFDHLMFPAKPHAHPLSPGCQTVAEIVEMVMKLNGPKANPEIDVMMIVTEARKVYSRRKAELKTPSPSHDISLSRSSLAELEKWLSPLSEIMDLEREALLKNVLSGSRQWLLKRVFKFLSPDDPSGANTNRVMWLKGVAGVGKSVMAAMVSRELQAQGMLGGLFFCKHDDKRRSSARNLVLTLVFGLAKFSLQFGMNLLQVMQDNADILSKSVFEMMKVLLVQPLKKVVDAKKLDIPVVLVVDALDECSVIGKRNEILLVFQELDRLLPDNVKMLVTGQPEVDIVKAFALIPFEIEPTAEENSKDQIEFTRNFLRSLNADQSIVDEGSEILVSKSAGIFVWLVTACTHLRKLETEEITLGQVKDLPDSDKMDGTIDLMYDRIFNGILQPIKGSHFETLIHAVLLIIVLAYEPLTAAAIVSLLDKEEPDNVIRCIRMLDSILVLDGSMKKIKIFHKSVKDYLTTPERCKLSLQIDLESSHSEFARLCISAMNRNMKFNMCDLPFSDFHSEIPDFDEKVQQGMPEHVRYAVNHFWEHCFDSGANELPKHSSNIEKNVQEDGDGDGDHNERWFDAEEDTQDSSLPGSLKLPPQKFEGATENLQGDAIEKPVSTTPSYLLDQTLFDELQKFLLQHGHHYLEACSLLDSLNLVISAMTKLQKLVLAKTHQLHTLMEDMKKVVQKFLIPLKASALQVYFTAVPFSPSDSEFFKTFVQNVPGSVSCPRVLKGQPKSWPSCLNILEGHSYYVTSASFSPDGQFVVSGSWDKTVRIWNVSTGQELHKLEGHSHSVHSAAFSPDGQFVVSGSDDKTVRIWNASTGQELHKLEGHSDFVYSAAFSPDGQFVVSGSCDTTVRIWNASAGQELHKLEGHSRSVNSAAFSPDGQFVVSGSDDKTVRIWDASTGQELHKLEGHSYYVSSAAFSPNGQFVVSGSDDKTVRIWNASAGQELHELDGHSDYVMSAAFSSDGQFVVSGSRDETVRIWNASTGQELHKLEGHSHSVNSAAFSSDGQFVVSGGDDSAVRIWNVSTGQELQKLEGHSDYVMSAAFSPDGQFVVSGSCDKTVRIWNASTGQELQKLEGHSYYVYSAAFSSDGQFVVSGSRDETVRIWNASTGQELHKLDGFSFTMSCAFSADGQSVVLKNENGKRICVNFRTGLPVESRDVMLTAPSLGHKFSARNLSAQRLESGEGVFRGGVWFISDVTKVCCWLSPEFRGTLQLFSREIVFILGLGFSSVIEFRPEFAPSL